MLSTRELVGQVESTRLCVNTSRGNRGRILSSRTSADRVNGEKVQGATAIRREAKQIKERVRRAGISETINGIHELNTRIFGIDNSAPDDIHFDNQAKLATCRVVLQHAVELVKSKPELASKLHSAGSEMEAIGRVGYQRKHSRRRRPLRLASNNNMDQIESNKENYISKRDVVGYPNSSLLSPSSTPNHRSAFKPYHRPALATIQSKHNQPIDSTPIPTRLTDDVNVSCYSQSTVLYNHCLSIDIGFQSSDDKSSSINGLDLSLKSRMTKNRLRNEIWRPWD